MYHPQQARLLTHITDNTDGLLLSMHKVSYSNEHFTSPYTGCNDNLDTYAVVTAGLTYTGCNNLDT